MDIDLIIRIAKKTDSDTLAEFFEENNRPEITEFFHPFSLTSQTAHNILSESCRDRYYVGIHAGRIVGMSMLRGWDEGFDIPSFGVFVDYRYHGRGFGRRLTEFAIDEARSLHCPSLRLSVYASDKYARRIYDALGFYEIERTSITRTEQPDTKVVMMKDLW